jgi:hypothetical protein
MDPVSIIGTVTGLVVLGANLSLQVTNFVSDVKDAPKAIKALSGELSDMCSILKQLEISLEKPDSGPIFPPELTKDLHNVLFSCRKVLDRLQALMKKFTAYGNKASWQTIPRNLQFLFKEKDITKIQRSLEAHKDTLKITLLLTVKYVVNIRPICFLTSLFIDRLPLTVFCNILA